MLSNHLYNLFAQIVEESKSLARIQECYQNEEPMSEEEQVFWQKMEADKKEHIEELLGLIKQQLV